MLATYKDNNAYLYIYYKDGIAKDAFYKSYKMDNLDSIMSISDISNADYKVKFFKNNGAIYYNNFSIDTAKKEFIGKSISDFNNTYNLKSANFVASTIDEFNKIYFYPLVSDNDEYKYPNYASNEDIKLGLVNPLNNSISLTNKTNNKDLSNYYKSAVALYVKDNKIQSIQIIDKQFMYNLIQEILTK